MTTSGSYTWNPAVTDLIKAMYRDLDVINETEEPSGDQYQAALFKLNGMVKAMEATGIHVWTEEEAILFLQTGVAKYVIAPPGGGGAQCVDADMWLQLQVAQNVLAGTNQLPLTTAVGVNAGDVLGVVNNANAIQWTTVAGAPVGNLVTLADDLLLNVSAGAVVIDYAPAALITRPLKVPKARSFLYASQQQNPMTIMSRQEYEDLPNKNSPGAPNQWFYSPRRDQGFFYVWNVPVVAQWAVRFTWYRGIQDYLTPDNTSDFPQEWALALEWMLADEMKVGYSVPTPRAAMIAERAAYWRDTLEGWDRESEPIIFGMDWQYATQR